MIAAKVTVYIPTHNYGRFLKRAIDSVIDQTFIDWELIVIDDGSTDETRDVLADYRAHSKIRLVEQENRGLNVTNNIALRLANGEYVMRLDADDYLDENILAILASVLDRMPEVGLVYPDYYVVNERGDVHEIVRRKKIGAEDQIFDLPAHGACTMVRKECLVAVGGYTEEFSCQDGYDLWLKMIARFKPYNVNLPLFYYRRHGRNSTSRQQRILSARAGIKRRYIEQELDNRIPRTLGLIPAVGRSIYAQSDPFVEIAGKPLLWYTLNEVTKAETLDRIAVSSDDERVLDYATRFDRVIPLERSPKLARSTARMEAVAQEALDRLKESGYTPEAVCTLYINTPLRRAEHIDRAVHAMAIFKTDSVISVQEELARMYHHRRFGLKPITRGDGELRLEREALFRANGAIYLTKTDVIRSGHLLGRRVGHIVMLPEESIKTNSEFDLWVAERVLAEWKKVVQL
jgi:CMP-N-acetylneuraminic acid synthetase